MGTAGKAGSDPCGKVFLFWAWQLTPAPNPFKTIFRALKAVGISRGLAWMKAMERDLWRLPHLESLAEIMLPGHHHHRFHAQRSWQFGGGKSHKTNFKTQTATMMTCLGEDIHVQTPATNVPGSRSSSNDQAGGKLFKSKLPPALGTSSKLPFFSWALAVTRSTFLSQRAYLKLPLMSSGTSFLHLLSQSLSSSIMKLTARETQGAARRH